MNIDSDVMIIPQMELQQTCSCLRRTTGEEVTEENTKRQCGALVEEEERGPAKKRGEREEGEKEVHAVKPKCFSSVSSVLEDEIWRLQEDNDQKDETIKELRRREDELKGLEDELRGRDKELRRREDELRGRDKELRRQEEEGEVLKKEQAALELTGRSWTQCINGSMMP